MSIKGLVNLATGAAISDADLRYPGAYDQYPSMSKTGNLMQALVYYPGNSGTGADGALTVGAGATYTMPTTDYAPITGDIVAGASTIPVTGGTNFAAGQDILIVQHIAGRGAATAGAYEYNSVLSVDSTHIYLARPLASSYFSQTDFISACSKAQVVRIRNYTDVSVATTGTLTCPAFDNAKYGVLIFKASGTVSGGGTISASAKGFPGGATGGGRSGYHQNGSADSISYCGGGGTGAFVGYNTSASQGGNKTSGATQSGPGGGLSYGSADLQTSLTFGGGGGSRSYNGYYAVGGAGGGLVVVLASAVTFTGLICSDGGQGAFDGQYAQKGGSGAGGSVFIYGTLFTTGTTSCVAYDYSGTPTATGAGYYLNQAPAGTGINYVIAAGKYADLVAVTGDQTVAGVKTFSSFPVTPSSAPTTPYQVANAQYADAKVSVSAWSGANWTSITAAPTQNVVQTTLLNQGIRFADAVPSLLDTDTGKLVQAYCVYGAALMDLTKLQFAYSFNDQTYNDRLGNYNLTRTGTVPFVTGCAAGCYAADFSGYSRANILATATCVPASTGPWPNGTSWTVSGWFKLTGTPAAGYVFALGIINTGDIFQCTAGPTGVSLEVVQSNDVKVTAALATTLDNTAWHSVVCVANTVSGKIRIYLDGNITTYGEAAWDGTTGHYYGASWPAAFGVGINPKLSGGVPGVGPFQGYVDEVYMWNGYAATTADVTVLANNFYPLLTTTADYRKSSTTIASLMLLTGNQSVAGTKTFSSAIVGSVTGSAASAGTVTGFSPTTGKTLSVSKTMTMTAADDTGVYTFPTGTKTLVASGDIVNADIAAGAAIVDTKLATISTPGKVAATALPTTAYSRTFTAANTTAGVIMITHDLGQKVVNIVVADNTDKVIIPDNVTFSSTTALSLDLSSYYAAMSGTWAVSVVMAGGAAANRGLTWSTITNNANAAKNNGYFIDATSNTVTLTFPATPADGDQVGVRALSIANTVTMGRNGSNIEKVAADLVIDTADFYAIFTYSGATYGWVRTV